MVRILLFLADGQVQCLETFNQGNDLSDIMGHREEKCFDINLNLEGLMQAHAFTVAITMSTIYT